MKTTYAADRPLLPAAHENPLSPGCWKKVLCQRDDLRPGTLQMINWGKVPVGKSFSAHYHEDLQEVFVIVQGVARMTVGTQTAVLRPGDAIVIDPHEVHKMWNEGDVDLEYVVVGITAGTGGRTIVVEKGPAEE